MKVAVILFNLGGPDSMDSVEPFLFNLFNDPAIISLPKIIRYPLAKIISKKRTPIAKEIYRNINGKSPILELTRMQSKALEEKLRNEEDEYKCFVIMRCWKPRATEVLKNVRKYNPEKIILLPLYPQYSATTSGSSIKEWMDICNKENFQIETKIVCCYPTNDDFILSHIELIKKQISEKELSNFILIFSAHGLPENKIKKGDPYQWQAEKTFEKIVLNLELNNLDYILSYQSRVGPMKWIGPSTDQVIISSAKKNKSIVLVPIAFVSEHSETLVELDIKYKKLANENGCKEYIRIPALGCDELFIKALSSMILEANKTNKIISSIRCPNKFSKCLRAWN